MINARQKIFEFINESPDIIEVGFHKNDPDINFGDVVDLALVYLNFQNDVDKISKIETSKFQLELEALCKIYGKDFYPLTDAWRPNEDLAGREAMKYMFFFPGIGRFYRLGDFFHYPTIHGWKKYRSIHIMKNTFPKWKKNIDNRYASINDLDIALDLSEDLCNAIRNQLSGR